MNREAITTIALLGVILLSSGCGEKPNQLKNESLKVKTTLKGRFISRYAKASSEFQDYEKLAKRNKFLRRITDDLNSKFTLPVNVTIALGACQDSNSYYNPRTRTITLCYELLRDIDSADFTGESSENIEAATYCILSVVYHEVGHALIDILGLHRQASVEDMADRFSTWLMTISSKSDRARYYAQYFDHIDAKGSKVSLHDSHLLNQQRRYNIVCLIYGSNAMKYRSFVGDDHLPRERAESCPAEWQGADEYWRRELKDYLKKGLHISFYRKYRFQNEVTGNTVQGQEGSNQ